MIIISQDKLQIFNFKTAKNIWIEEEEVEINQIEQVVYSIYIDGEIVGEYETEERAKEVIREIIKKYEKINLGKYFNAPMIELHGDKSFVYEMPEE